MSCTAFLSPLTGKPTENNYRNIPAMCKRVGKGAEREMGGMDEGQSVSEVTGSADGEHGTIQLPR